MVLGKSKCLKASISSLLWVLFPFDRVFSGFCSWFLPSAWLHPNITVKAGLLPLLPLQMGRLLDKNISFLYHSSGEVRAWNSRCTITGIGGTWRFLWGAWTGYSGSAPCWFNTDCWRLAWKLVTADVASLSNAPQFPKWPFCSPLAMKKVAGHI